MPRGHVVLPGEVSFPRMIESASSVPLEALRNRLLRRVDWRFFLPSPTPTKSICFAGDLLGEAVRFISRSIVDAKVERPRGDCDLAVAVDPDKATLRAAWAALRPGGSCYTEWHSFLDRGVKGLRKRLEAVGFEDVVCYRATSEGWIPLEAPGALRHLFTNRPRPRTVAGRVRGVVGWCRRLLSPWLRIALPVCAISRKPPVPSSAMAITHEDINPSTAESGSTAAERVASATEARVEMRDTIRAGWEEWGLGARPDRLSWLLLTGGERSTNKVVALVFAEPDSRPRMVVKMARIPESVPALSREAANLRALHERPGGVRGAPRVLFCRRHGESLALGETALAGIPFSRVLRRENYPDLAFKATAWQMGLAGRPEPSPPTAWWGRLIEPVLSDFESSFGPVLDSGLVRETGEVLATLGTLPLICEQGDFAPWNVLLTANGDLAVLDWEAAELQGLPARDLIKLLTYSAFFIDEAWDTRCVRESYRATLNAATLTGEVSKECLRRYTSQVNLDPSAVPALRLLVWLVHSRWEYRRMVADVAGQPGRDVLRRSFFLALWEEQLRCGTRT